MIPKRLVVENYRGKPVPAILGIVLAACLGVTAIVLRSSISDPGWAALWGAAIVFLAGLLDDLSSAGARGLRGHARSLLRGRPTTGLLKIAAGVLAGVLVVAAAVPLGFGFQVAGVLLIAGCTNVWNGLDVTPGRALKFFLIFSVPLLGIAKWNDAPLVPALVVSACFALVADVRERALLGDSGANLLGFSIGVGLYTVLPGWGIVVAAVAVICLNLVAETITFSRVIDTVRPLRWFDRLGTLAERRSFSPGA